MSCLRALLAIIFPPLAVCDKGCGSFLIVTILSFCGWIPGVIAALIILNKIEQNKNNIYIVESVCVKKNNTDTF